MRRRGLAVLVGCLVAGSLGWGCAAAPEGGPAGISTDAPLPPGYGSLRQEEITMTLRSGSLQLKATPLEEWIIRLAAPDTHDRLAGLVAAHRTALVRETGIPDPVLVLVSVFSDEAGTSYEPEDLTLVERGKRYRPLTIRAVTSGWGTQRLAQRETLMAIYAFAPEITFDMGLGMEYRDVRNRQWDGILQRLQSEYARARARAGSSLQPDAFPSEPGGLPPEPAAQASSSSS